MIRKTLISAACFVAVSAAASAESLAKPVEGPMLLCLKHGTFALQPGERVTDYSGGGELMTLTIDTGAGSFDLSEGEIFSQPRRPPTRIVYRHGRTRIYRMGGKSSRDYAGYDMSGLDLGKPRLVLWLHIPAQWKAAGDADIYRRLQIRDTSGAKCPSTFSYWM